MNAPDRSLAKAKSPRVDHVLIAEMVEAGARVLDVGCGDGELLQLLAERRGVDGRGVELQRDKVALSEKVVSKDDSLPDFDETLRTALRFLASPWKLWETGKLEDRRAVLKLAFSKHLRYDANEGFRTAETTLPFKVLETLQNDPGNLVRVVGIEPTLLSEPDFESGASTSSTTPAQALPTRSGARGPDRLAGRELHAPTPARQPLCMHVSFRSGHTLPRDGHERPGGG